MYATVIQTKLFAHEADSLVENESWELLITAASRMFDNLTEVTEDFYAAATGESDKVFYGDGTAYLRLPPYVSLGTDPIVILDDDDNEMEIPDYLDQNGTLVIRGQGIRYRRPATETFEGWPLNKEITVSANWGFATIPADVTMATIQIALQMFRGSDPAKAVVLSETPEALRDALPLTAKVVIDKYKQQYSQAVMFV